MNNNLLIALVLLLTLNNIIYIAFQLRNKYNEHITEKEGKVRLDKLVT